jgi:CubicO group peptidase (beta-lactamase class C family)
MTRTPPNRALPRRALRLLCAAVLIAAAASPAVARVPTEAALDAEVARAMAATQSRGLAIAVIDKGRVVRVRSYGARNAAGAPLQTDTIMYGASLTKSAFAYLGMQLVE